MVCGQSLNDNCDDDKLTEHNSLMQYVVYIYPIIDFYSFKSKRSLRAVLLFCFITHTLTNDSQSKLKLLQSAWCYNILCESFNSCFSRVSLMLYNHDTGDISIASFTLYSPNYRKHFYFTGFFYEAMLHMSNNKAKRVFF